MPAERGQQFFYHGSTENFNEGDVILPRSQTGAATPWKTYEDQPEFNRGDVAYATDHPRAARKYARIAAKQAGMKGHGNVYQVVPVDPKDVKKIPNSAVGIGGAPNSEYHSVSGFKVIKAPKKRRNANG